MPIYQFRAVDDGEVLEERFAMGEAPSIGEEAEIQGRRAVRIVSDHIMNPKATVGAFAAQTIDPDDARALGHTRFDATGAPVFLGKREAQAFSDRSEGDYVYGGLAAKAETVNRLPAKELARRRGLL